MPATAFDSTAEGRDAVASYATADGAQRAVLELMSLGYDEGDLALAPRDFDAEDTHPLRTRLGTGARSGALVGVCVAGAVEALRRIGLDAILSSVVPRVGAAALVGAAVGVLVAVIVHERAGARMFGTPDRHLVPNRYDVLVDREPEQARLGLARWWDPAAPPAGWEEPA